MYYVTPAQLANGPDMLRELSELFNVPLDLMATVVAGDLPDPDDWSPAELAAAASALAAIEERIVQAQAEVDARLARRGYVLPMDAGRFPVLAAWSRSIARYHLHPQREGTQETTGRIERDYKDALRALEAIARGELTLGAGDPLASASGAAVHIVGGGRMFNRNTLGGL